MQVICGTPKFKKFTAEDMHASWRTLADGELISNAEVENARIYKFKLPEKKSVKRLRVLLDRTICHCQDNDNKPDVIHLISPVSTRLISRLKIIKQMGIKIVFSYCLAHTFSKYSLVKAVQKYQINRVYKNYDDIIVASRVLCNLVQEISQSAKIHIIPNGVDTNKFTPVKTDAEKNEIRTQLKLPGDATLVVLVGAVHPRKGTHLLIEAWSKLVDQYQDLHLVLIGPRYDQSREELNKFKLQIEEFIQQSGFPENVHFTGSTRNVSEYLRSADIFVFPSKKEGMPNAVLEAMAVGLPVVLTPFVGLSDDFGKADEHYLLADRNSEAIASAVKAILDDQHKKNTLSDNARKWIVGSTSLHESVQQHANIYQSYASDNVLH